MFIKFGEEEHITDLFNNGTIYMNSVQHFRKFEDGQLRGDKYEGVSSIKNYPQGTYEIPSMNIEGEYVSLQLRESFEVVLGNIFSLYCISSKGWDNPLDFQIDERVKKFGSHCLIVKKNDLFLKLIEHKLRDLQIKYTHDFVEYYNKNDVNREINLFEKPNDFEYQKEFRIYADTKSDKPLIFNIGSLKGIAEIYPSESLVDTLKIEPRLR